MTLLVIGEEPDALMGQFDEALEVPPYIVKRYEDRAALRKRKLETYETNLRELDPAFNLESVLDSYLDISAMDPDLYFDYIAWMSPRDFDRNILSTSNPRSIWDYYYTRDDEFPVTTSGITVWKGSARVGEVDWELRSRTVRKALLEGVSKDREGVRRTMERYGLSTVNEYVDLLSRYHDHAVIDQRGLVFMPGQFRWFSQSCPSSFMRRWMVNFFERFIRPLDGDTLLTSMSFHY